MKKSIFFKIELIIYNSYYGDGIIKMCNNEFEGYIAFDYVYGLYKDNTLCVTLLERDIETKEMYESSFVSQVDFFELPDAFFIVDGDTQACIGFKEKISMSEQSFDKRLETVKQIFA